jgi:phytoene dehydrogenase-like protein
MPAADLLDEWFESDVLKGAISAISVRDITWGPKESGTAYTLLYHWALAGNGLFRPGGIVRGGMGALTGALAAAATAFGAEIRTGTAVERILVEDDQARGIALSNGEEIRAERVMSNADPRTTFLGLLDPSRADAGIVKHVRNIKYRGSAARIHLALSALPEFSGVAPADAATLLAGSIQIAPTLTYLQRAYDCTKYGEFSPRPYLDITIPSLLDPGLAPAGQHVMSITAKFAPYALREGDWNSRGQEFLSACLDTLAEYAPKLRDLILHQHMLTPLDIEREFHLPEASAHQGEMTLDQFFHMRPIPGHARYRAPLSGLYLCGAGTHPGGGVTGVPGRNAARELLADD